MTMAYATSQLGAMPLELTDKAMPGRPETVESRYRPLGQSLCANDVS